MLLFTDHGAPIIKCKAKDLGEQRFSLAEFISVKGVKARGKRLSVDPRAKVVMEDTPDPNLELEEAEAVQPIAATEEGPVEASEVDSDSSENAAAEAKKPAPEEKSTKPSSEADDLEGQSTLF